MHKRLILSLILAGFTLIAQSQSRTLEFYLTEGIQNSPLINDYRNQINSAISDSILIIAAQKPLIELKSQLQYSPFYQNFGYDEVLTDGGNYSAVLGVSQNIFNKRSLENKYRIVSLLKQSVNNSLKITTAELNKIITAQYLTAYSDYSDLLFNKTFLELFQQENEIIKQFVQNGVRKQTDYLAILIETQTQEILVAQLKSQYKKDLLFLNQLCGLKDTASYVLDDPKLIINGTPDINKNPSYIGYKIDSLRITNEKLAIDINYQPKISWFADAGFLTSNPWNFYHHFGYSAGISLNIPVYDGKQRTIEKQKLDLNENSRQSYQDQYHNQFYMQIEQLREELMALDEMSLRMENQLKTSVELVKSLKNQLESGMIQMTEYINALRNLRSIKRNLNLSDLQKYQVINELNFIMTK